uniref:Uncharacterized protein n=1 Tax=Anguilla anguilla TaxID=7936 RepID=A0A0E9UDL6_ANGAN
MHVLLIFRINGIDKSIQIDKMYFSPSNIQITPLHYSSFTLFYSKGDAV